MPFTLLQVDTALKSINPTGGLSSALTLPSGITLRTDRVPRFARFNRYVIVVNTPTRPLMVDTAGVVYPLTPNAPVSAVALAGTGSGSLSGNYLGKQTFVIKDVYGNIITESDYSPTMASAAAIGSSKNIAWTIQATAETTGGSTGIMSRLYRSTTGGTTYFQEPLANDQTGSTTSFTDSTADASLNTAAAGNRGTAPDLTLIAEWAGRLWGVDRTAIDNLRYTEADTAYAWYSLNTLPIPHVGMDEAGITALIPRRNALGAARLDVFNQVTGNARTNFAPSVVPGGERVGCVSQESVVVYNDMALFLWRDGVYMWDNTGIHSVSDSRVRSWFATDDYFNRAMFWRSFASFDWVNKKYRLHLASAGSTVVDRWVEFDLSTGTWWGPHYTDAFVPTCAVQVQGSNQQPYIMIGSSAGYLSQDQSDKNDWGVSPIAFSVETKKFTGQDPRTIKVWGELEVYGAVQATGTISVTRSLGKDVDTMVDSSIVLSYDMTKGRQRFVNVGTGNIAQLKFANSVINQDVQIRGFEINSIVTKGRR